MFIHVWGSSEALYRCGGAHSSTVCTLLPKFCTCVSFSWKSRKRSGLLMQLRCMLLSEQVVRFLLSAVVKFQCGVRLGKLLCFGGWFGSPEQGASLSAPESPGPAAVFLQGWVLLFLRHCRCPGAFCAATHTPSLPHGHKCSICLCVASSSLILTLLLCAFLPKQVCMHVAN